MAVTIKDVAKLAGVSPSTVSRVCNGNPAISKDTREKVLQAISALNYELPSANDALPPQAVKTIGIILPPSNQESYEKTFYLKAIRGISQIFNQRKVATTIVVGADYEELLSSVQILHRSGSFDGFIMLYSRKDDPLMDYLCEHGLLYVVVGRSDLLPGQTLSVDNDNIQSARDAVSYLMNLGHRKICYLGSDTEFLFAADRKAGYQLEMLLNNLPITCVELSEKDFCGTDHIRELLRSPDRPTAFVVCDDILALPLEQVCAEEGLSIPEDLSILAFNNSLYAQLATLQLTTVDINPIQLGQEAAQQLITYAENPNLVATRLIVPHMIVPRNSCKKLDT